MTVIDANSCCKLDGAEVAMKRPNPVEEKVQVAGKKVKSFQTSLMSHFGKVKSGGNKVLGASSSPLKSAAISVISEDAEIPSYSSSPASIVSEEVPKTSSEQSSSSQSSSPVMINLTLEEKALYSLEIAQIPECWFRYLRSELSKPYFARLKQFLADERQKGKTIFPPDEDIYSWARLCPLDRLKVVIIGQDPYHNDKQAMGLCFSVSRQTAIPPSLVNIYKELSTDIPGFVPPRHGDLTHWAEQGVLLLNTSLTVRAHEPASHAGKGWEQFTDAVIRAVNVHKQNVVFILWGNHAQKKAAMIDRKRHFILTGVHPSPLSASRGFFGCKHFSKTNEYLQAKGLEPIDWQLSL